MVIEILGLRDPAPYSVSLIGFVVGFLWLLSAVFCPVAHFATAEAGVPLVFGHSVFGL